VRWGCVSKIQKIAKAEEIAGKQKGQRLTQARK
jgi:hypothetical protein